LSSQSSFTVLAMIVIDAVMQLLKKQMIYKISLAFHDQTNFVTF